MEFCQICGLEGARRHYQGLACQRCRVFFIRTVAQGKSYICQKNSKCFPRNGRFACSYCRYKHCLLANMQPTEVRACQKKTMAVGYFTKVEIMSHLSYFYQSNAIKLKRRIISPIPMNFPVENLDFMIQLDRSLANVTGSSPYFYESLCTTETSLQEILFNRKKNYSRDLAFFHLEPIHGPPMSLYKINLTNPYSRMMAYCAELSCFAKEFRDLSHLEQLKLFQFNCIEMGLLSYLYANWLAKVNTAAEEVETQPNNMPFFLEDDTVFSFEMDFYELQLTEAEIFLLKVITLFRAPPSMSSSLTAIFKARDSYTRFLWDYLKFSLNTLNVKELNARISKIFPILERIREVGRCVRHRLAFMAVAEEDGLKGQLPFDIHFKEYS